MYCWGRDKLGGDVGKAGHTEKNDCILSYCGESMCNKLVPLSIEFWYATLLRLLCVYCINFTGAGRSAGLA
jgi:hypothetical protein